MLTHHNIYPSSILTSTERTINQYDPVNSVRYNSRHQHLTVISRPDTVLPVNISPPPPPQPSVPYLTNTSVHHQHHPFGRHLAVRYPIEISATNTSTNTATAPTQQHQHHHKSPPSLTFVTGNMIPSPPASFTSPISNLRYDIVLEAPPATAQRTEDYPLTYLNKNQFYTINLVDLDGYDGVVTSTLTIMFHEESHRRLAGNYWRFWFGQQKNPQTSRAIDINISRCSGIQNVQHAKFDRITFDWNGHRGATIQVRLNCLSTDFSRIKGVKGIPLRLHMESFQGHSSCGEVPVVTSSPHRQTIEASYCKIKLFRDKGAERKNKDATRQLERQMEKLRGKDRESHSLWLTYHRAQSFTIFSEIPECISPATPIIQSLSPTLKLAPSLSSIPSSTTLLLHSQASSLASPPDNINTAMVPSTIVNTTPSPMLRGSKRPAVMMQDHVGHSPTRGLVMTDIDPTYVPLAKQRVAKLSFFARFPSTEFYCAVYLEELSVKNLVTKVVSKIALTGPIQNVIRQVLRKDSNSMILIRVDDAMVQDIPEEQDMDIDTEMDEGGMMTLVLRY